MSDTFVGEFEAGSIKQVIHDSGVKANTDLMMIPYEDIVIKPGFNVRVRNAEYEKKVEELTESILRNGFYKHCPLPIFPSKDDGEDVPILTGGFRRYEAAGRAIERGAEIKAVPCIAHPPGTDMGDLFISLMVDNTGAPLSVYEQGLIAKRLIKEGWTEEDIAERMCKSPLHVKNLLSLQGAPVAIRNLVIEDKVSGTKAIKMIKSHGAQEALRLMTEGKTRVKGVSSKKLSAAIDYACDLPSGGIEWLNNYRRGDKDAVAEINSLTRKPRAPRKRTRKAEPAAAADTDL